MTGPNRFEDQDALVIGASRGVGLALAEALALMGIANKWGTKYPDQHRPQQDLSSHLR